MDTSNIITAPQIDGVDSIYRKWLESHTGSLKTFYTFITTPSSERDGFINSIGSTIEFIGSVASLTVKL